MLPKTNMIVFILWGFRVRVELLKYLVKQKNKNRKGKIDLIPRTIGYTRVYETDFSTNESHKTPDEKIEKAETENDERVTFNHAA